MSRGSTRIAILFSTDFKEDCPHVNVGVCRAAVRRYQSSKDGLSSELDAATQEARSSALAAGSILGWPPKPFEQH